MAHTSTIEVKISGLRGPILEPNTEPAPGPAIRIIENRAGVRHQLSRLEQIVEYLKVLYR